MLEHAVLHFAHEQPQLGQAAVAQQLQQAGIQISASGVRYIWKKHNLETTAKRLQALADNGEQDTLSEQQQRLLERNLQSQLIQTRNQVSDDGENQRRYILLSAAAELFAKKGFERTSIRDIASQAGLLPGSVYHYFASKTELFLAIHQEGFSTIMKQVQQAANQGIDPWDRLTRALAIHIAYMVGDAPPVQRLTGQSLALTDYPELRDQLRPYRIAYENIIRRLVDKLPLQPDTDRSLLRLTLLGASNWVFLWYRKGKKTPPEIAQIIVDMLRHGVSIDKHQDRKKIQ